MIDVGKSILPVGGIAGMDVRFFDIHDSVDTESGNSFFQPPVDHFVYFLTKFGIFPV